jgi:alkylhydroperoxidase family enzyme
MNGVLQQVEWESCLVEPFPDPALQSYVRRKWGIPNPTITYFASVPWLARAVIDLHPEYGLLMHLDQAVADLVVLVVSQENSCRFCYAAVRGLLWAQGMSWARIQRMEQDLTLADLPPRTLAAVAFGRNQSRLGPAGARAARETLGRAGLGVDEMKEIAFTAALTDFNNRVYTIPAIPAYPIESMPDRLYVRLLRPLLGLIVKRHRYRGQPTVLDPAPAYAYGRLVETYAGSPIGAILARTLVEMWASPHLTRRCKLLMIAVIARGLGCEVCAPEVSEALRREGLKESTLAQVLTHLDAPELDDIERLLVPFARETIWYEPAPLQRRARMLRDRLSGLQFLEAIGVASLANGLCRMGATVMDPHI